MSEAVKIKEWIVIADERLGIKMQYFMRMMQDDFKSILLLEAYGHI